MHVTSFLSLFALQACAGWAINVQTDLIKRSVEQNATLYAYGGEYSAWPIAFGRDDGLLYITENPTSHPANLIPVTWGLAAITDECWIANATFANGTRAGSMFIESQVGNAVGVFNFTRVADFNGTVTGFLLFASQLVYNNNTKLQAQFWAKPISVVDTYALMWNYDGVVEDGSFPVVVKAAETNYS